MIAAQVVFFGSLVDYKSRWLEAGHFLAVGTLLYND
jgi:hypothetical protein